MSRQFVWLFPESLGEYLGDALWAVAVYLCWGLILPEAKARKLMLLAVATAYLVEFSQLYQAVWIDEIRAQRIGHLALGSTFNTIDLVAYTFGIVICYGVDSVLNKHGWFRTCNI